MDLRAFSLHPRVCSRTITDHRARSITSHSHSNSLCVVRVVPYYFTMRDFPSIIISLPFQNNQTAKQTTTSIMTTKTTTVSSSRAPLLFLCFCFLVGLSSYYYPPRTTAVRAFVPLLQSALHSRAVFITESKIPSSLVLFQGGLGSSDFSRIFGKQEAEERRQREIEMEYHPPPKPKKAAEGDDSNDDDTEDGTKPKNPVHQSAKDSNNGTVIRSKYVPPPSKEDTKKRSSKNISPLLDGNYE